MFSDTENSRAKILPLWTALFFMCTFIFGTSTIMYIHAFKEVVNRSSVQETEIRSLRQECFECKAQSIVKELLSARNQQEANKILDNLNKDPILRDEVLTRLKGELGERMKRLQGEVKEAEKRREL
jgi:hypothetical protein